MFLNTVARTEWINTKIYTTDILLWKFYAELNDMNLNVLFGQGTLFITESCQGLAIFENGLEELAGTYLLSTFSEGTCIDVHSDYKDVTEEIKILYENSLTSEA